MTSKLLLLIILMAGLPGDFNITTAHRSRRSLAFRKGSTFFYRLNYKIASVEWTTIFNQASGFKVSWPLPDGTNSKHKRSVYDLHEDIKFLYERTSNTNCGNCTDENEDHQLECQRYSPHQCPLQLISIDGFSQ